MKYSRRVKWAVGIVALAMIFGLGACTSNTPAKPQTQSGASSQGQPVVPNSHQHIFSIDGTNMQRTLQGCRTYETCVHDRVLFNLVGGSTLRVRRGDIVVFHAPTGWTEGAAITLVSRVIATGGQTVKGDSAGQVMISDSGPNGPWKTLTEPYVFTDGTDVHANFGPVTVPAGRFWIMGDHRNDSADSRFFCGAGGTQGDTGAGCDAVSSTIPISGIIGIAAQIVSPQDRTRSLR